MRAKRTALSPLTSACSVVCLFPGTAVYQNRETKAKGKTISSRFVPFAERHGYMNDKSPQILTATNSTIVYNSSIGGDITTTVGVSNEIMNSAKEIIAEMTELLKAQSIEHSDEILEILESISDSLKEKQPPKKGFLTALVSLCSGTTAIASLSAAIVKLFSQQ